MKGREIMSSYTIKCPVCHSKITDTCYNGPLGTEEEYIDCPKCNYSYEFAYGYHREVVHNKQFIWSYHDYNQPNIVSFFKKLDKAMFMARRNWKKQKKPTQLFMDPTDNCISPKNKRRGCKKGNSYITYNSEGFKTDPLDKQEILW